MSIVGPRPLAVQYLPYYNEEEQHRHDVRPGLSGLAQVNGRNAVNWEEKFAYDIEYVNKITFLGDIKIILRTVKTALMRQNIGVRGVDALLDFDEYRRKQMKNTEPELNHFKDSKKKIIYYAGTLNSEYGIETLTDAFMQIQGDEYELWICGDGDARETVEKAALADKRIRYYGFVDKEKADELRDLSDVLVNPRTNEGAYTKYSFPSKTIEYMLAAKPIIMYKLDGIPIEYDCFLNYVSGVQPIDLAKKIVDVCVADSKEAEERAHDGRKWILKNKNPKAQMAKLLRLFENRV